MVNEVDKWNFPYDKSLLDRVKMVLRDQTDKYQYMLK